MPGYRLPQNILKITMLDEVGMASADRRVEAWVESRRWCTSDNGDHVVGVAQLGCENAGGGHAGERNVSVEDYVDDASAFALSYCRDFRALHQLNHDHDCNDTCVKCMKKKPNKLHMGT